MGSGAQALRRREAEDGPALGAVAAEDRALTVSRTGPTLWTANLRGQAMSALAGCPLWIADYRAAGAGGAAAVGRGGHLAALGLRLRAGRARGV